MTKKVFFITSLILCFVRLNVLADSDDNKKEGRGLLKGSEAYFLFFRKVSNNRLFIDKFANKEAVGDIRFSLWRSDKKNVTMDFGTQSILAPNKDSKFVVSLISFNAGFSYYWKVDKNGRYRLRSFLVHRSQHELDLQKLGIKIPKPILDDLKENVFADMNVIGAGIERQFLPKDKLKYKYALYLQPFDSRILKIWDPKAYNRPVFLNGEVLLPRFFKNKFSFYASGELGGASVGLAELRFYPIKNLAMFLRQGFISQNHEAVTTSHEGIVYKGLKAGFFIKVGNLFN